MRHSLIVAVLLLGGCMHQGASESTKQLINMEGQIGEEIFTKGAEPGSELARSLLVGNAAMQTLVGKPKEAIPYTSENMVAKAKEVVDEANASSIWGTIMRGIYGMAASAASAIPGAGWAIPILGILGEWFRRRHKKIKATAQGMVATVNQIKDAAKTKKLTPELINSIAKSLQDGMGIREEVRGILKAFKSAIDKSKKREAAKSIKNGGK